MVNVLLQDGIPLLALMVQFLLVVSSLLMTVVLATLTVAQPYVAKRFRKRYVNGCVVWVTPLLDDIHCVCDTVCDCQEFSQMRKFDPSFVNFRKKTDFELRQEQRIKQERREKGIVSSYVELRV